MKLLLGQSTKIDGMVTIDIAGTPDRVHDLNIPLDYEEGSVEEVTANHVLEHLHHDSVRAAIASWVRALKPGAKLIIEVPDLDRCIGWYLMTGDDIAMKWIFGEDTRGGQNHYWGYNRETLYKLVEFLPVKAVFAQPLSYQSQEGPVIRMEVTKL